MACKMKELSVKSDNVQNILPTACVFSTTRKSVISAPAWPPTPKPAVPIALGADHAERSQGMYLNPNRLSTYIRHSASR